MKILLLLLLAWVVSTEIGAGGAVSASVEVALVLHNYEARIRVDGRVTTTQVKASDAGQAKKLVQQQFPGATVLSVKKVD